MSRRTRRERAVELKSQGEVAAMRQAGLLVGETLELLRRAVAPGMSTAQLDALAEEHIRAAGGVPSFKGYHGFPATICTSVNEEIVHGIPGERTLRDGDLVSIDCGAVVDGWHGDSAVTVPVGDVDGEHLRLLEVCEGAMWHGIAAMRPGGTVSDIGCAVEAHVRAHGRYGIVEEYVGHGIGTSMHMDPQVPNYAHPSRHSPRLVEGIVLAVEPMVNLGSRRTRLLADEWTVVTEDASRSAHFEHTVALTGDGPWVLTALDGGAEALQALGVSVPSAIS